MSKISIILPTYNVEKYIARALDSCINQTFKDIEIIIIDDFGNDKSIDIAKEYAKKDERIKIIYNDKNLGTFASRNIGVLNSNSPYIMFLDPDDYLDLKACEIVLNNINDNNLLKFGFYTLINNGCEYIKNNDNNFNDFNYKIKNFIYIPWNMCCIAVKKEFYISKIKEEMFNKNFIYSEDMLSFLLLINERMCSVNFKLYNYCINDNSITNINCKIKNKKRLKDAVSIFNIIKNMDIDKNISRYYLYFLKINILSQMYNIGKISYFRYKFLKKIEKIKKRYYMLLNRFSQIFSIFF